MYRALLDGWYHNEREGKESTLFPGQSRKKRRLLLADYALAFFDIVKSEMIEVGNNCDFRTSCDGGRISKL